MTTEGKPPYHHSHVVSIANDVAAAVAFLALASPAKAWTWPASGPILQAFRYGSDPYAAGQHRGIDVGGDAGAPVAAPRSGVVSFAGSLPTNGLSVTIETADGFSVTLVHLGSIAVTRGGHVAEGQAVGAIGPSGTPEQDAPYVHLGIRTTSDPNGYLDPLAFSRLARPSPPVRRSPTSPTPAAAPKPHTAAAPGGSCAVAGSGCRECTGHGRTGRSGSRGFRADARHATAPGAGQGDRACAGASRRRGALGSDNRGPAAASLCCRFGHAPPGRADPQRARTCARLESGSSRFTTGSRGGGRGRSHPVGAHAGAASCHAGLGCADGGRCACWAPAGVGRRGR